MPFQWITTVVSSHLPFPAPQKTTGIPQTVNKLTDNKNVSSLDRELFFFFFPTLNTLVFYSLEVQHLK